MHSKVALLLLLGACIEGTAMSEGALETPRILAVLAEPAESSPGASVRFTAVVVPSAQAAPSWSFCRTPRRAIDNTSASPACATLDEQPIATGAAVDVVIPADACRIFGSETAAGTAPNLADASGGYYQPLRITLGTQTVVARHRIRCALASAPIDAARQFAQAYRANQAPTIVDVETRAVHGQVALHAVLDAPEAYLVYDPQTAELREVRETLSLAWFVSSGDVEPARGEDPDAVWRAGEDATLWLVVRDDRGASAVATFSAQTHGLLRRLPSTTGIILPSMGLY